MDTRFPPLGPRVQVPLYPQKGRIFAGRQVSKKLLEDDLCQYFSAQRSQLLLADSASNALLTYLKAVKSLSKQDIKVALPTYNCLSLAQAVVSAGCLPVFTDLSKEMSIDKRVANFVINSGCQFLIWPNYFGTRLRNESVLSLLRDHGVRLIFDEAQSFPNRYDIVRPQARQYADLVMASFASTKAIAGIGGGCLYSPNPDLPFKQSVAQAKTASINNDGSYRHVAEPVRQKIVWALPIASRLFKMPKRMDKLDELLESMTTKEVKNFQPISSRQSTIASHSLRKLTERRDQHGTDYKRLMLAAKAVSADADKYIKAVIGTPSIIALRVGQTRRYEILRSLSQAGIQATWYYFPLNKLSAFRKYNSQSLLNTNSISAEVIILPFQWKHSKRQKNILLKFVQSMEEADL